MTSRYSSNIHQRDLRTQLFSSANGITRGPIRSQSPYDKPVQQTSKENESFLSSLESQNNEELDSMAQKVSMIKDLGIKMGVEINKSVKLNDNLNETFEKGKVTLKNTYNKMVVMSERAGISCKYWFIVFFIVFLWFFYVWIT
ncbi:protein transport protein Bet1p [[Candida] jaroonii]|uniref:Protein transport protein Bet1p n=1 Tax=[Candida] jaroonii TaxID=467808 RepID=A0ACA9Y6J0_9ASCO|nr:protein transport protein Bet1p [[Candida] jaroonii]